MNFNHLYIYTFIYIYIHIVTIYQPYILHVDTSNSPGALGVFTGPGGDLWLRQCSRAGGALEVAGQRAVAMVELVYGEQISWFFYSGE